MDDYAGRVLAGRYRLPRLPFDAYDLVETRAFDTYSGQEVLVRQIPLPEVVDAEVVGADGRYGSAGEAGDSGRPADPAVRRAIDAAAAAAGLPDHPRLDQVFDVFAEDDGLWIVSELVAARPLAAVLAEKPMSPHRAAEVAADILTALRALHAHGWTHRNITARTVLVCDDGRVVLTGLAAGAAEEALCGYDPVPPASDAPGALGIGLPGDVGPGPADTGQVPVAGQVGQGPTDLCGPGREAGEGPAASGQAGLGVEGERGSGPTRPGGASAGGVVPDGTGDGEGPVDPGAADRLGGTHADPAVSGGGGSGGADSPDSGHARAARAGAIAAYRAGARAAARATARPEADGGSAPALPGPRSDGALGDRDDASPWGAGPLDRLPPGFRPADGVHGASAYVPRRDGEGRSALPAARTADGAPDTPARLPEPRQSLADAVRRDEAGAGAGSAEPTARRHGAGEAARAAAASRRLPMTALAAERARQARILVVGAVTERWAPEQAGPVHENWQLAPPVGPATDLWALGALLFRAVQGHAPFPEENATELVQLVCAEPPAFAEECGPLRPIVESLLRQDPTERPEFEELRGWLRSLIRSAPEPDLGRRVVTVPSLGVGAAADPRRLPVLRRRGELVRRRRAGSPALVHGRHKRSREKRQRGPRSLGRTLVGLILLALIAAIAYAMLFLPRADGDRGQDRTGSAGPVNSAPAPPDSSQQQPQSTEPADLPKGFALRQDPAGFTLAVHEGWERRGENSRGQIRYLGDDVELIVVPGRDSVDDFGADPMAYQQDKEEELEPFRASQWAAASGLRRIDVGRTAMAEGIFTWKDSSGREVYARNLAMIVEGRYHLLLVIGPDGEREAVSEYFRHAANTYRATG
ncbi:protein kinase [Streptomyces sp. KR80]|uniref:protein kinase n=1 Tax=Streptomyces sp. KR80 TaxID=3457426 RepID=UPI003FD52620